MSLLQHILGDPMRPRIAVKTLLLGGLALSLGLAGGLSSALADTGTNAATFKPGALTYGLSGTQTGDSSVLIEKSNGSF